MIRQIYDSRFKELENVLLDEGLCMKYYGYIMKGDHMQRTTIMLPRELKIRAASKSRKMGVSLGQLIREALQKEIDSTEAGNGLQDCFYADKAVYQGDSPPDFSAEHDEYLYGESHDIR